MGARGEGRGNWEVVEKEREKDLGKVVTGGGEGTKKQTTENTENTEIGKEEADTLVRPYNGKPGGLPYKRRLMPRETSAAVKAQSPHALVEVGPFHAEGAGGGRDVPAVLFEGALQTLPLGRVARVA